jgi:hypothetical protein
MGAGGAAMRNLPKMAEEDPAVKRYAAFSFGIDAYCDDHGIDKQAFADSLGVKSEQLPDLLLQLIFEDNNG